MNIDQVLKQCKFSKRYQGYLALRECIQMVMTDENRLLYVTDIYSDVGNKMNITWSGVERNIRTARDYSWNNGGKEQLEKLAGGILDDKPPVSELIEILACYLKEHGEDENAV